MSDLRDDLRALVAELESLALYRRQRCRTANAEGNKEMDAYHDGYAMAYADCKLRLDAILARQGGRGETHIYCDACEEVQPLERDFMPADKNNDHAATDLLCVVCRNIVATIHHRPPSTPPMTREALEEAERQGGTAEQIIEIDEDGRVSQPVKGPIRER